MANKKSKRSTGKRPAKKPVGGPSATSTPTGAAAPGAEQTSSQKSSSQPQAAKTNREKRHEERDRAKAALEARKAAEARKSRLVNGVIIGAVVVLVLGLGLYIWKDANKSVVEPAGMTADYGMRLGEADAAQKIVIFEDFRCGPCGAMETQINSSVDAAVQTGTVSIEYRPINQLNNDYSKNAAQAFWAVLDESGAEVAKEFHDLLFANQPDETGEGESEEWLAAKAAEAGADRDTILSALQDDTYEGLVEESTRVAQKNGPKDNRNRFSTPGVLINDVPVISASSGDVISKVNSALTAAIAAQPTTTTDAGTATGSTSGASPSASTGAQPTQSPAATQ